MEEVTELSNLLHMEAYGEAIDPLEVAGEYSSTLRPFFKPKSACVVGATDRPSHVGRTVLANIQDSDIPLYGVNPKRSSVLGVKCYPSIPELPEVPELVIVVTPAITVPKIVGDCVDVGVKSIIVISAGFKEVGPDGVALENEILGHLRRSRGATRLIGPNCLGVQCPEASLNASFATQLALKGKVAFISQSGAMCTSVLDWAITGGIGFSHFVSIGSMLDVDWADLIDYLGQDSSTNSILIYMETVGEARKFLSAARAVSFQKPIIVLKAGRTDAAAAAAVSHTGSLAGSDAVLDCAFERAGIVRVNNIGDLFRLADLLSHQPIPNGPHLTIITNAGGPGVLAVDALVQEGGKLTKLDESTMKELDSFLPAAWSHANPVDVLGSATPDHYARALDAIARDSKTDGILVIMVPVGVNSSAQVAQAIRLFARQCKSKPILAAFSGGEEMAPGKAMLTRAGIATFDFADDACRMFSHMWGYRKNLNQVTETATLRSMDDLQAVQSIDIVKKIIEDARYENRTVLTEAESKQVLAAYNIPVVPTWIATSADSAVKAAEKTGYPVVLKIHSETITHKSDVGGVVLNLTSPDLVRQAFSMIKRNVRERFGDVDTHFLGVTVQPMLNVTEAYELIIGSHQDVQFGPVILFGTGGFMVEVIKDTALGLPPLNNVLARRIIRKTKAYKALCGVRGRKAINFDELDSILTDFGRLVTEHPEIKECDINPLLAFQDKLIAVDARVVLVPENEKESTPPVAIRPYPSNYVSKRELKNGKPVLYRPMRWEDKQILVDFHTKLSEDSVIGYFGRSVSFEERTAPTRMIKIAYSDYARNLNIIAVDNDNKMMGIVRIMPIYGTEFARFLVLVADPYQKLGIGSGLIEYAAIVAKREGFKGLMHQLQPGMPATKPLEAFLSKCGYKHCSVNVLGKEKSGWIVEF